MPIKPTLSDAELDAGHLLRSNKRPKTGEGSASSNAKAKSSLVSGEAKKRGVMDNDLFESDFEKGIMKMRNAPLQPMPGTFSSNRQPAPAFHPESLEQMNTNLEANWKAIEERKLNEAKQEPQFGRSVQKYLDLIFKE